MRTSQPPVDEVPEQPLVWDESDSETESPAVGAKPWRVLVVDDDVGVQRVTALVLAGLTFRDRPVELLTAYSGTEALAILRARRDVALVILDVVMETDDAGLRMVQILREDLSNQRVRVVLRTGQPGRAPEPEVVSRYEIDGYHLKTELTSQNLVTMVVSALRAFDLLETIERSRAGLDVILEATASLSSARSQGALAQGVLDRLGPLVGHRGGALFCAPGGGHQGRDNAALEVLASVSPYEGWRGSRLVDVDTKGQIAGEVLQALDGARPAASVRGTTIVLNSPHLKHATIWLDEVLVLDAVERQLLDVFCSKVAIAFDNVQLNELFHKAQQATVVALADLAEHRDTDTGDHVLRVARTTELLARQLLAEGRFGADLDELFVEQVGLASMLHDVGKVAIPDAVLRKPGPLDLHERRLMETHAGVGERILSRADQIVGERSYLTLAIEIATGHHEWFDGRGYPSGLAGSAIPLSARIAAVADVFDALTHWRPYKAAWPEGAAMTYLQTHAGTQFDPVVVYAFEQVVKSAAWRHPSGALTP